MSTAARSTGGFITPAALMTGRQKGARSPGLGRERWPRHIYRGRERDADGRFSELHVDVALAVIRPTGSIEAHDSLQEVKMSLVRRRGEGEILYIGRNGRRPVEILIEPTGSGTTKFTMGAQTIAPGNEVPLHKHHEEEILFVYAGTGRITVAGVVHEVGPETAVLVPSATPHRIENTGPEDLRMTFTLSPAGYEKVFRDMARTQTEHPIGN
jgi:mannose-6-phosphate isomerase-like protein (cupin superfamily)